MVCALGLLVSGLEGGWGWEGRGGGAFGNGLDSRHCHGENHPRCCDISWVQRWRVCPELYYYELLFPVRFHVRFCIVCLFIYLFIYSYIYLISDWLVLLSVCLFRGFFVLSCGFCIFLLSIVFKVAYVE